MKVRVLFKKLALGELSNLSIIDKNDDTLYPDKYPKIIDYTNQGLLKLYSRFLLKEVEVLIQLKGHITNYFLKKEFSEAHRGYVKDNLYPEADVWFPYIKDLRMNPFKENIIRIISVYDSGGEEIPLNDPCEHLSVFTPQPNLLQVPNPVDGLALSLHCQAKHDDLKVFDNNELTLEQEIDIPFYLEEPLRAFVAFKTLSHMNAADATAKGQEYYQMFEMMCQEIDMKDLSNETQYFSHTKLEDKGFI